MEGSMSELSEMTQERWNAMTPAQRDAVRDLSDLSKQLIGFEGWRVEVYDVDSMKPRRFIVGRSTGWRPCHLEMIHNRRCGQPARESYASVRRLVKIR